MASTAIMSISLKGSACILRLVWCVSANGASSIVRRPRLHFRRRVRRRNTVSKRQPISNIEFTSDGNSLIVSTEDGRVIRVFQIRPLPSVSRGGPRVTSSTASDVGRTTAEPWHVYNLRRGRTSAVVEAIKGSEDGRWIAVGTRKRTVHVFAVNPYGGKPDNKSHLEGRVQNVSELVSIHHFDDFVRYAEPP